MSGAAAIPISGNVIAAGRQAWQDFKASQALGLDQLMDVGRALLAGRHHALSVAGADRPAGKPYIGAFRAWCAAHGFDDLPTPWRMDLIWCAEHEAEVRAAHAAQAATRSRSAPSINPRTLRQGVTRQRHEGAPRRRRAPTVAAMPIATLCDLIGARLAQRDGREALGEIAALAGTLEAVARRLR